MSDRLTAGAKRVLEAVHEAQSELNSTAYHQHLLTALLRLEGKAAEILKQHGISDENINSTEWTLVDISFREWSTKLQHKADHFAMQTSAEPATGSEHLLLAAIELDPETARLLEAANLPHETVYALLSTPVSALEVSDDSLIRIESQQHEILEGAALERALDASANRCREGLRVVEDFVRFRLDDAFISGELKKLRHGLQQSLSHLGQSRWAAARDTAHDVGTQISTQAEAFRGSMVDVVRASLKRVEEALRSLEEFGKMLDSHVSKELEQTRYRFYTIEKMIETNFNSRQRLENCRLYLLVTDHLCRYGSEKTIRNVVESGVDIIQVREKGWSDRKLLDYCKAVRKWTADAGVLFIVNDRPDIAALSDADGVHVGQDDVSVFEARKIMGGKKLVGVSTHSLEQVGNAIFDGADYLGVGPCFPSQTKEFDDFPGLQYVHEVSQATTLPWFALGGINEDNLLEVIEAGASRVAVSGVICGAAHPKGVSAKMASLLGSAPRTNI